MVEGTTKAEPKLEVRSTTSSGSRTSSSGGLKTTAATAAATDAAAGVDGLGQFAQRSRLLIGLQLVPCIPSREDGILPPFPPPCFSLDCRNITEVIFLSSCGSCENDNPPRAACLRLVYDSPAGFPNNGVAQRGDGMFIPSFIGDQPLSLRPRQQPSLVLPPCRKHNTHRCCLFSGIAH